MKLYTNDASSNRTSRRKREQSCHVTATLVRYFAKKANAAHHYVYKANKPITIAHLYSVTSSPGWLCSDQITLYNKKQKSQHTGKKLSGAQMEKTHLSPLSEGFEEVTGYHNLTPGANKGESPCPNSLEHHNVLI